MLRENGSFVGKAGESTLCRELAAANPAPPTRALSVGACRSMPGLDIGQRLRRTKSLGGARRTIARAMRAGLALTDDAAGRMLRHCRSAAEFDKALDWLVSRGVRLGGDAMYRVCKHGAQNGAHPDGLAYMVRRLRSIGVARSEGLWFNLVRQRLSAAQLGLVARCGVPLHFSCPRAALTLVRNQAVVAVCRADGALGDDARRMLLRARAVHECFCNVRHRELERVGAWLCARFGHALSDVWAAVVRKTMDAELLFPPGRLFLEPRGPIASPK